MKPCYVCKALLPLDSFPQNKGMKDGRVNKCKACTRAYNRQWYPKNASSVQAKAVVYRANNKAKIAAINRAYIQTPEGKASKRRAYLASCARHPEKRKARQAVNNAIAAGKLVKQPCEKCGAPAEAHHDDYSKPLEVRWLCLRDHRAYHRSLSKN